MTQASASAHASGLNLRDDGFVTFHLGDQLLGIPVVLVQEVLMGEEILPVPLSPREVKGFLNLRGQIVTAVDLRALLGLPDRAENERFMNVVVENGDELFSLLVDRVGDVMEAADSAFEPTPSTLDPAWKRCCSGVIRLERGLLIILDVDLVLSSTLAPAA